MVPKCVAEDLLEQQPSEGKCGGDPRSGPSPTASTKPRRAPQLSPSWEGPFKVMGIHRPGSNHLATTKGVPYPDAETSL